MPVIPDPASILLKMAGLTRPNLPLRTLKEPCDTLTEFTASLRYHQMSEYSFNIIHPWGIESSDMLCQGFHSAKYLRNKKFSLWLWLHFWLSAKCDKCSHLNFRKDEFSLSVLGWRHQTEWIVLCNGFSKRLFLEFFFSSFQPLQTSGHFAATWIQAMRKFSSKLNFLALNHQVLVIVWFREFSGRKGRRSVPNSSTDEIASFAPE